MTLKLTLLKRLDTFKVSSLHQPHDSAEMNHWVSSVFGSGEFVDRQTFQVNRRHLKARAFVIATGSDQLFHPPGLLAILQMKKSFPELPQSLAVIGGGPAAN